MGRKHHGKHQIDELIKQGRQEEQTDMLFQQMNKTIARMTDEEKARLHNKIRTDLLGKAPRNAEELYRCVEVLFNVRIPHTACFEYSTSPFEYFASVHFGWAEQSVGMAARNSGKTMLGSIQHYLWNSFYPNNITRHAAATKEQAKVASGYLRQYARDPVLSTNLVKGEVNKFDAQFRNGSNFAIVTGTMAGVCLSGETSVITSQGVMTMQHLVGNRLKVKVRSFNKETGELEWKPVVAWHNNGKGSDFLRLGLEYKKTSMPSSMTPNHMVCKPDGTKVRADKIQPGDEVGVLGWCFSAEQRQVILGTLLGDASIDKHFRLTWAHGTKQYDYAEWKAAQLAYPDYEVRVGRGGFGTECVWYRFSPCYSFYKLREEMYVGGVKKVNVSILNELDDLGLAIWFMDDGSRQQTGSRSWCLYTNGFSLAEHEVLCDFFEGRYGARPTICTDKGGKHYLYFSVKGFTKLTEMLEKYISHTPETGKRWGYDKQLERGGLGIQGVTVTEISTVRLKRGRKYDITVADNHNYVLASGLLVSNSGQHPSAATWDEIEFWDIDDINQTWYVPTSRAGMRRTWAAFSTRQRCLPYYARIITEDGHLKIGEVVNKKYSGKVLSLSPTGEWEWKRVTGWHRNGSSTEWYKVYLAYTGLGRGCELIATGDHHIYTAPGHKKPLKEMVVGDTVCVPSWIPDAIQEQVLFGTLLGDGCVSKGSLRMEHSHHQLGYLEWKTAVLSGGLEFSSFHHAERQHHSRTSQVCAYLHRQRVLWYPNGGGKRVPKEVWGKLGCLGLAIWLMDDGSYRKRGGFDAWHIYTNGWVREDVQDAAEWLKTQGISSRLQKVSGKTEQYYLYIGGASARKLSSLVAPYIDVSQHLGTRLGRKRWVAPAMGGHGHRGVEQVPIERIEVVTTAPQGCYDITVEDNHNYLNGSGVLVSNSHGAMAWLVDHAQEKGVHLFTWTAFETMARCKTCVALDQHPHGTEQQRMSVCNLWEDCHGKRGVRASGWVPREEVCKMKKTLGKDQWRIQGLCEKPSSHGLVFYNFEHEYMPHGNYTRAKYDPSRPWYGVHDPAEGKKSVFFFIQLDDHNRSYIFDEIIDAQCPDVTKAKVDVYERCLTRGYGDPEVIVVDPHRTDAVATWRTGTPNGAGAGRAYRADVPPTDNASGGQTIMKTIEFVRTSICDGSGERQLFVNPAMCPGFVRAIKEYHYPSNMRGEVTSDTPDKAYKDEMDTIRYWEMYKRSRMKMRGVRLYML